MPISNEKASRLAQLFGKPIPEQEISATRGGHVNFVGVLLVLLQICDDGSNSESANSPADAKLSSGPPRRLRSSATDTSPRGLRAWQGRRWKNMNENRNDNSSIGWLPDGLVPAQVAADARNPK